MTAKPLFIPLRAEYFEAFQDGSKEDEYRPYGPRWNERTCTPGRRVVLSKGYGLYARLSGNIARFRSLPLDAFPDAVQEAYRRCYGNRPATELVAAIGINLDGGDKRGL